MESRGFSRGQGVGKGRKQRCVCGTGQRGWRAACDGEAAGEEVEVGRWDSSRLLALVGMSSTPSNWAPTQTAQMEFTPASHNGVSSLQSSLAARQGLTDLG